MRQRISFCSLHPTRDVILDTPDFAAGQVNRAARWFSYPGGKALNAARTAGLLGGDVRAVILGPPEWRGMLGKFLARFGVDFEMIPVAGEGRICVMINERGRETVINTDLSMRLNDSDISSLTRAIRRAADGSRFVVFAGSPPPGLGLRRLKAFFRLAAAGASGLVIDQAGKVLRMAVTCRPWLIKPNLFEFQQLLGRKLRSFGEILAGVEEARRRGAQRILLSLGDRGTLLATPEGRWFARAIKVKPRILSPIGCGDALLGAFLESIAGGADGPEALKWGVAAATANLFHRGACFMPAGQIRNLYRSVAIESVK